MFIRRRALILALPALCALLVSTDASAATHDITTAFVASSTCQGRVTPGDPGPCNQALWEATRWPKGDPRASANLELETVVYNPDPADFDHVTYLSDFVCSSTRASVSVHSGQLRVRAKFSARSDCIGAPDDPATYVLAGWTDGVTANTIVNRARYPYTLFAAILTTPQ